MSSFKRSMFLNCDGTNGESWGFHFVYHSLLHFAVMKVGTVLVSAGTELIFLPVAAVVWI